MPAPTASELVNELKLRDYLPEDSPRLRGEREAIETAAREAMAIMADHPTAYRAHVEQIQEFLSVLWRKYDCEDLMDVVRAYARVEPILLDLERDEEAGHRYRDHSVHSFNVFIFGLRLLSKLIGLVGPERAQAKLKVKPERIHDRIAGFRDWSYQERLFYLWTLMSAFHDITIPLEHLGKVSGGLNQFASKFGLQIVGPTLLRDALHGGLDEYLRRLGSLFRGEVAPDQEGLLYDQSRRDPYVERYLRMKFENNDHGVLSGLLVYRKIEEIWILLRGKAKAVLQTTDTFEQYAKYVLQQDIARASLGMSLHNLQVDQAGAPVFLPIRFESHPLAFILILSDGLQEYLRWEGTSIVGATKFCCFPSMDLASNGDRLQLEVEFFLTRGEVEEDYLKQQARRIAAISGNQPQGQLNLTTAGSILLNSLRQQLKRQIDLDGDFRLVLTINHSGETLVRDDE